MPFFDSHQRIIEEQLDQVRLSCDCLLADRGISHFTLTAVAVAGTISFHYQQFGTTHTVVATPHGDTYDGIPLWKCVLVLDEKEPQNQPVIATLDANLICALLT